MLEVMQSVLDEVELRRFNKAYDRMHFNISRQILEDAGNGSIF